MIETYEIVALVACFLFSGIFSGSEAVLMSINIDRARQIIEAGGAKANALNFMVERPNELLTTILVGNNVVNIFASSLMTTITARVFSSDSIGIAVGITTFVILIFGEIIPKTFARTHAETLAVPTIRFLQSWYIVLFPIIKSIVWFITTFLGENAELTGRLITKLDIEYMVQKAEKENTIDSKQVDLLHSVLDFPKIKVKDIMIPRQKIKYLKTTMNYKEVLSVVEADAHSRFPVCEDELENMKGFLHVKELVFLDPDHRDSFKIENHLKTPFFVYEHMKIQAVFDHMNRKKVHLALVKDENGLVVGIITLEDIVEEIFGEIQDEHDEEEDSINKEYQESDLESGIYIEGSLSLRDLYNEFSIKIPLNDNYSTVSGFILDMLGNNFPEEGQIIVWEGLSFELKKVQDYEIREVRIQDVDGEKHFFSRRDAANAHDEDAGEAISDQSSTSKTPAV
ncbi:hemolysin family protein [Halobacteriovorax sp. HLS]|uniref:hemolysin family protein n=1 Tax=Halobacteriovorax sp. HLS TaxID=2234000 RepID=UPI000FD95370|nr:hemolysin family protein [Halobacteriovorax sp. HLS]